MVISTRFGSRNVSLIAFLLCVFVQHEKYTSQLQLSIKALEAKAKERQQLHSLDKIKASVASVKVLDRAERRANSLTGTRLCPCVDPAERKTDMSRRLARSCFPKRHENRCGATFSRATQRDSLSS